MPSPTSGATPQKRSPITTHILDISRGKPAAGVSCTLEARSLSRPSTRARTSNHIVQGLRPIAEPVLPARWSQLQDANKSWKQLGAGATNADGRIPDLLSPGEPRTLPSDDRFAFKRVCIAAGSIFRRRWLVLTGDRLVRRPPAAAGALPPVVRSASIPWPGGFLPRDLYRFPSGACCAIWAVLGIRCLTL